MANMLERFKAKKKEPKKTMADHAEDALFREVSEEVKAQETYDFVKKHAKTLIVIALAVLIAVVGVQIARHHAAAAKLRSAAAFESAMQMLDDGNPRAASAALLKVAESGNGGIADLSLFNAAKIDLQTGDRSGAAQKLQQLVQSGNTRDFRDLALVNLAVLNADSMTPGDFEKFVAPLLTKRSPFYFTGLLFVAQKYLASGDATTAGTWLDKIINDADAPKVIAAQAEALK